MKMLAPFVGTPCLAQYAIRFASACTVTEFFSCLENFSYITQSSNPAGNPFLPVPMIRFSKHATAPTLVRLSFENSAVVFAIANISLIWEFAELANGCLMIVSLLSVFVVGVSVIVAEVIIILPRKLHSFRGGVDQTSIPENLGFNAVVFGFLSSVARFSFDVVNGGVNGASSSKLEIIIRS